MREVLDAAGQYLEAEGKPSLQDFAHWITAQHPPAVSAEAYTTQSVESENFMFVARLNRFAKIYSKLAFSHSAIRTVEEFSILVRLWGDGPCPKSIIIHELIIEFSVGAEIIRRLVRQDFVTEQQSTEDKRQKIISISENGQKELFKVLAEVRKVSHVVNGRLSQEEKESLHFLLRKLHDFHQDQRGDLPDNLDVILERSAIPMEPMTFHPKGDSSA